MHKDLLNGLKNKLTNKKFILKGEKGYKNVYLDNVQEKDAG